MNSPLHPGSSKQASSYRSSYVESHGHIDAKILVPDPDHRARVDEVHDIDLLLSGSAHATLGFLSTARHRSAFHICRVRIPHSTQTVCRPTAPSLGQNATGSYPSPLEMRLRVA